MNKIPKNAKKVFEGEIFSVFQWEQELFDGSTKTFEAIKRLASTQLICVTENKKLLIFNEEQPHVGEFLSLPGGQVEVDEEPLENAKKELMEETGMEAETFDLWELEEYSSKVEWETYYYIVKGCKYVSEQNCEGGEKITINEVSFEEFIGLVCDEKFRNKSFRLKILEMIYRGEIEAFRERLGV